MERAGRVETAEQVVATSLLSHCVKMLKKTDLFGMPQMQLTEMRNLNYLINSYLNNKGTNSFL